MQLGKSEWIVSQSKKQEYYQRFYSLSLTNGKASGGQIKQIMMKSQLSNQLLINLSMGNGSIHIPSVDTILSFLGL